MNTLKRLFNPEIFQGVNKDKNYFEGYYFKLVDKEEKHSFAFISGIAFDKNKSGHSFIQWIDAENYNTEYFRFSEEDFEYSNNRFFVKIKENEFSKNRLKINLKNRDYQISGNLVFSEIVNFDKNLLRPNIMGPFTFVPFIECYHGIVNISHQISGKLVINGKEVDFTGMAILKKTGVNLFQNLMFGCSQITLKKVRHR